MSGEYRFSVDLDEEPVEDLVDLYIDQLAGGCVLSLLSRSKKKLLLDLERKISRQVQIDDQTGDTVRQMCTGARILFLSSSSQDESSHKMRNAFMDKQARDSDIPEARAIIQKEHELANLFLDAYWKRAEKMGAKRVGR